MKARWNLFQRSEKPITIKLTGHEKEIKTIDCVGDFVLSGSDDNKLKLWDLKSKQVRTFDRIGGSITKCKILEDHIVCGGLEKYVWVYKFDPLKDIDSDPVKGSEQDFQQRIYKCEGFVTSIQSIRKGVISVCDYSGRLSLFNLDQQAPIGVCT